MVKNILIISSEFTGHGHKSITESLCEKFSEHENVNIHIVDGFSLGGQVLLKAGKSYGPITRNAEGLWELIYDLSSIKPSLINEAIEFKIKDNFLNLLKEVTPDLILSVHPNFNGSIINIMEKYNIKIPFITLIADLVSIYPLWADPRADYIISPTQEAKDKCIGYGVSEEKIKVLGLPVRSRFYNHIENEDISYDSSLPLQCLIMSGGEGVGNMSNIAEILLDNFNCKVRVIAGRNAVLKKKLEQLLVGKYGDNVEIFGFTKNVQDLMFSSDIAITRGSPNVMMEAISCNVPLVITGALPGQEQGNPEYVENLNLGVICTTIKDMKSTISDLLSNDAEKLNQIKTSQINFSNPKIAENIVNFILSVETNPNEFVMPEIGSKFIHMKKKPTWYKHLEKSKLINIHK